MELLKSDKAQKNLLSGIILFNLLDIIFTLTMIQLGLAVEANPFMIELLNHGEFYFGLIKISLVSFSVFLLWRLREHRIAQISTLFCFTVYGFLMLYHLFGIFVSIQLSF